MNDYKKSLWISNFIVLLFAILATVICKISFNEILMQQQELTAKRINSEIVGRPLDNALLENLIDQNLFNYIKISHSGLSAPLVYKNENHYFVRQGNHYFMMRPTVSSTYKEKRECKECEECCSNMACNLGH